MSSIGPSGEIYKPTLLPAKSHDAQGDAENLRAALKSFNTDEHTLINILGERSYEQRMNIKKLYESTYGRNLINDIEKECSGTFGKILLTIFLSPAEIMASFCKDAMKGAGTDEDMLATIIGTATNKEMKDLKEAYKKMFEKDFVEDVRSEVGGNLERVLIALLQGNRDEPTEAQMKLFKTKGIEALVDMKTAKELANQLYNAGEGKVGTDEEKFLAIIARQSVWNLAAVDYHYADISGKSLLDALKSELSGPVQKALVIATRACLDRPSLFADLINESMKGLGTDEIRMTRLLIARSEIDLGSIKEKYQQQFNTTLKEKVQKELSAYSEKMMLKIIGE